MLAVCSDWFEALLFSKYSWRLAGRAYSTTEDNPCLNFTGNGEVVPSPNSFCPPPQPPTPLFCDVGVGGGSVWSCISTSSLCLCFTFDKVSSQSCQLSPATWPQEGKKISTANKHWTHFSTQFLKSSKGQMVEMAQWCHLLFKQY